MHPDPHKMSPDALRVCGCERCQDALRMHALVNQLITSAISLDRALDNLERRVGELEDVAATQEP